MDSSTSQWPPPPLARARKEEEHIDLTFFNAIDDNIIFYIVVLFVLSGIYHTTKIQNEREGILSVQNCYLLISSMY